MPSKRRTANKSFADFPPAAIARRLLSWFDRNKRPLVWRSKPTAYRVWISEIMLQQTQAATVTPYFERFVKAFPDVHSLARAPRQRVLREWEGLGYYRRAHNLHRAAQIIDEEYGGEFPLQAARVRALPGIGKYTAGAILSIADNQRLPILEGNTVRLFSRMLALPTDVTQASSQKRLWEFAEHLLPRSRPGDFNQALMEVGSEVCFKQRPECPKCPLRSWCRADRRGDVQRYPIKLRRDRNEARREVAFVIRRGKRVLLRQCGQGERWEGLWDFPRYHWPRGVSLEAFSNRLLDDFNLQVAPRSVGFRMRHAVTRYRIDLHVALTSLGRGRLHSKATSRWVDVKALGDLPLNTTARRIVRWCLAQSDPPATR